MNMMNHMILMNKSYHQIHIIHKKLLKRINKNKRIKMLNQRSKIKIKKNQRILTKVGNQYQNFQKVMILKLLRKIITFKRINNHQQIRLLINHRKKNQNNYQRFKIIKRTYNQIIIKNLKKKKV